LSSDTHHYQCPWVRAGIFGCHPGELQLLRLAAGCAGRRLAVRLDGMPPIRDMAKLQFGQSFCQIEGHMSRWPTSSWPRATAFYFAHHQLLWKDPGIQVARMPLGGVWKRWLQGCRW